jgi:hypothetical protein
VKFNTWKRSHFAEIVELKSRSYVPISDYALIGDMHGSALVSREGDIDWLCWPRLDSPAVFLRLLDAKKGGSCTFHAKGLKFDGRRYEPGTNVLESRRGGAGELDSARLYADARCNRNC